MKTEDTGLATTTQTSQDRATEALTAQTVAEVQGAIIVARRFPRDEDAAAAKIKKACSRLEFAECAQYAYPRGKNRDGTPNIVKGESVYFAREFMRIWGNMQAGTFIVRDDQYRRAIRSWAWDLETNVRKFAEDEFEKVVQRKSKTSGRTEWVTADERDLRELHNKRAAILERNAILSLFPDDIKGAAIAVADETILKNTKVDANSIRKVLQAFADITVEKAAVEKYLRCAVEKMTVGQLTTLREIWAAIRDGAATWADYQEDEQPKPPAPNGGNGETKAANGETKPANGDTKPANGDTKTEEPSAAAAAAETKAPEAAAITKGTGPKIKALMAGKLKSEAEAAGWKPAEWVSMLTAKFGIAAFTEVTEDIYHLVETALKGGV